MRIIKSTDDFNAAISEGLTVIALDGVITTQEAADLLNMSRPTLVKRLEEGVIPFTTIGTHRRLALADVLAYREAAAVRTVAALQELEEEVTTLGLPD